MDRYDEYRLRAAEARQFANKATSEADRAAWLKIEQSWLSLLAKPQRGGQKDPDDQAR
jgi:hypothetical protein